MLLSGQDEELRHLESLFDECARGRAMTVMLEGGAGCGKSDLMEGFAQYAMDSGAIVLGARDAGRLRGIQADGAAPGSPAGLQESSDRLAALAARSPVVVCIDDSQGSEEPTWRWILEAVRRRLRNSRVMLVFTLLPFGGASGLDIHCDLLRQTNLQRIRLLPLDRARAHALWEELNGGPTGAAQADALHTASGGNPLLVRALAEEMRIHGPAARPDTWPCPGGLYAQAALDCVRDSGPLAASVAVGMAALREFSSPESLAAVLRLDPAEIARGEYLLQASGLVAAGRLRHPVVESAVLEHPEFGRRDEILLRVAEYLRERGAGAGATARYLLEFGAATEPWQTATLQRAADEALDIDDAQFADACLALAHDASTDCWERARLVLKRSVVMMRTDPWRAEQHYLEQVARTRCACGTEQCEARTVLKARLLLGCGRLEESMALLHAVAPPADAFPGEPDTGPHYEDWHWLLGDTAGTSAAWIPAQGAVPGGTDVGVAMAPSGTTAFDFGPGMLRAGIRDVREIEDQLRSLRLGDTTIGLIMPELRHLMTVGRPDLAGAWCAHFAGQAAERGVEGWRQLLTALRAEIALALGSLTDAETWAQEAVDLAGEEPAYWLCGGPLTTLVTICTVTGRYEEAARLLGRPLPESFLRSLHGLTYLRARGQLLLTVGRPHLALSDFLAVGRRAESCDLPPCACPPWRIDAAEAWLRLGNHHEAEQLLTAYSDEADEAADSGQWLRVRAQLAQPHDRPGLLTRSAERFQVSGKVWELARVLADLAEAYQDLGQPARADLTLRKARQLAEEYGAGPLYERIVALELGGGPPRRSVLGALHRPDPAAKLSESERRVAVLAAQGLTNREISAELFITVSTVEQHLTRVYKKLDITSRQELPLQIDLGLPESA
ncbi:LuxR C-terminal-related transcriptional regulator [Streptomyces graminilatus]|uniref:LuxR C-terminal-related transcriptional regulator n=1 Tax=Streptomyces graminilatus TaxID=1464070 RepID=UPI0006E34939|nr:LuxR C-terminal-related transcriptional regulator [Streptomyces graminilatus]